MAGNFNALYEIAEAVRLQITQSPQNWLAFLESAGRLYTHPFDEQILIYGQKPGASVCKTYAEWNTKERRWIKGGAKGIALYDDSGYRTRIKHVFDVSDTNPRHGTLPFQQWELPGERAQAVVFAAFPRTDPMAENALYDAVKAAVDTAIDEDIANITGTMRYSAGSFDEEMNAFDFHTMAYASAAHIVMARTGVDMSEKLQYADFRFLEKLDTPEALYCFGHTSNRAAKSVLGEIEKAIAQIERDNLASIRRLRDNMDKENPPIEKEKDGENSVERDNTLPDGERAAVAEPVSGESRSAVREIRDVEENPPQNTAAFPVQRPVDGGRTGQPPQRSGRAGRRTGGADHGRADGTGSRRNTRQGKRPDGLDGLHEQSEKPGGGNRTEGDSVQQLGLFDIQAGAFDAPAFSFTSGAPEDEPPGVEVYPEDIAHAITTAPKTPGAKFAVQDFYSGDHTMMERIALIKAHYGTDARPITFPDGAESFLDFNEKQFSFMKNGMVGGYDFSVRWGRIDKEIQNLISSGAYLTDGEKEQFAAWQQGEAAALIVENTTTEKEEPTQPLPPNYRITHNNLGVGSEKTRVAWNLAAIRTLKQIEAENRPATEEEQEVLHRYVGWGALSNAFDEKNSNVGEANARLKELLTEAEYRAARASTLNAHYTSPTVIDAIYSVIQNTGFTNGNVLEPSCGVGNFFGMLPTAMRDSKLYGVELDSITGRIAKQLYPHADIRVQGFEDAQYPDSFFDVAIGNVPFGSYKIPHGREKYSIHDYFFVKTLDKVRPGGIVAFITSSYTMDKKDDSVRRLLSEKADLLGAIRLPNNAFLGNAGTQVTTDILFLQKRDKQAMYDAPWVQLIETEDGIPVNRYYAENPHMVLGTMVWDRSMYGNEKSTACHPIEGAVLSEQLEQAVPNIRGRYVKAEPLVMEQDEEKPLESIPALPDVRNFSFADVDGKLYYRENSVMNPVQVNDTAAERIRGLIALREITRTLIELQMDDAPDEQIAAQQARLDKAYTTFTRKYGLINSRGNNTAFSDDSSYYLLCSLEVLNEKGGLERKSDIFTKRTIRTAKPITHADTASEALAVSIAEKARVDLPFMQELLGEDTPVKEITEALQGVIFHDPIHAKDDLSGWITADEYLSGNIREKLRIAQLAAESDPDYRANVESLQNVMPKDLEASEIEVRLGATWVPQEDIQAFMLETFNTAAYAQDSIKVMYSPTSSTWRIQGKSADSGNNVTAHVTYGSGRANAYKLLEDCLNLHNTKIYDTILHTDGKKERRLNKDATMAAQAKQEAIKQAFGAWIFKDPDRRHRLVEKYNEIFNSYRAREYDGSHIQFVGMNPEITLNAHQRNAVARSLYGGNTLLAHAVGAGKTFEMAATAMEAKRLGLCTKSLVAVPNHITEQFASEWLQLYPSANLLVASKKDFEKANRKKFCSRIATGDYDAVIIGHSQLGKIPVSTERQIMMVEEQVDAIVLEIRILKETNAERFTIKQAEKTRKGLEARLKALNDTSTKDDVVTFEELGVDRLFIDEADEFKNLFLYTKMRNVAGIPTSESKKASDLYMKCGYLDEITNERGTVFATGTPISNSIPELYTNMRYLQRSTLERLGLMHFDAWASTFGETVTSLELAPEGTGFRMRTRFARFYNLPELVRIWKNCADIQTADMLNLPVPKVKTGKPIIMSAKPTPHQKILVSELADRAEEIRNGRVPPYKDNMLKVTGEGRKLALDQRIIDPTLPDNPGSKVNMCVEKVFDIWAESAAQKSTQLIFCDMSTPTVDYEMVLNPDTGKEETRPVFNVYRDVREKLLQKGVPQNEIAFIHDAKTEKQKAELFAKVRAGTVRVLLGSTAKMGAGTNVQTRLCAIHHLDPPWRPRDIEQRNGRGIRQKNLNAEIGIYNYVTEGTFDAYIYGILEHKERFIKQIVTGKTPIRSCEDIDGSVLNYAEIKALATGNPLIMEKFQTETDLHKLESLKSSYTSQRYRLEDAVHKHFPAQISATEQKIAELEKDLALLQAHKPPNPDSFSLEVGGTTYTEKKDAGQALIEVMGKAYMMEKEDIPPDGNLNIGHYNGFEIVGRLHPGERPSFFVVGTGKYEVSPGTDSVGMITRLDNIFKGISTEIGERKASIQSVMVEMEAAKAELKKPFEREDELAAKKERLKFLTAELRLDEKDAPVADVEADPEIEVTQAPEKKKKKDRER